MGAAVKGVQDAVLGRKDPGSPAQQINIASPEAQRLSTQAMQGYGDLLNQDTSQLAANQTQQMMGQARQGAADQEMQAKQMVAQRGLGNTSLGLNAILNTKQDLGRQLGAIQANQPLLQNQLRMQNLQAAGGGISQLMGAQNAGQIYQPAVASRGRQGGLAPLLGAGLGASMGGPAGAQIGAGLGQYATQIG